MLNSLKVDAARKLRECSAVDEPDRERASEGLHELALGRGLEKFRVSHKRNARGELVIALIVSPDEPALTPEKVPD